MASTRMLRAYPHNAVVFLTPRVATLGLVESRHYAIDTPDARCTFEMSWCATHTRGCGGFDVHHEWPEFMGGPSRPAEGKLLVLCPTHHRRQHALIRAMVEAGTTAIHTSHHFAPVEWRAAIYAITQWHAADMPAIKGWSSPAAVLKVAA
jgi:hypothetical protein